MTDCALNFISPAISSLSGANPASLLAAITVPAEAFIMLGIYCAVIVTCSLLGGALPQLVRLTHKRMQMVTSLVSGLMLGIALFHLLPHGIYELPHRVVEQGDQVQHILDVERGIWWMVMGLILMFFMLRMFHFHDHSAAEVDGAGYHLQHDCGHEHDHDHEHSKPDSAETTSQCDRHAHELSWVGVFFGLSVHTLIDGVALGASIQTDAVHATTVQLFGFGTFLAIMLHKPLDAVSITSLMSASGWSSKSRHTVNVIYSLMCPIGAAIFMLGVNNLGENQGAFLGCTLAFSAGVFLSISLVDLLPELEFHSHDRLTLSGMLVLGLAIAYGIGFLEPAHVHKTNEAKTEIPSEETSYMRHNIFSTDTVTA